MECDGAAATAGHDSLNVEDLNESLCHGDFMRPPSKLIIDTAISEFIDWTGNTALASGICTICACETRDAELS